MGFVINGSGFGDPQQDGTPPAGASVKLKGIPLTVIGWTANQITVQIPGGAATGDVVVTVSGPLTSNGWPFTVTDGFGCGN
jgi:uncharacterized protein (TIGR03437 family)